jgi:thiol-disulfide isomerase/thioredoxin
MSRLSPPVLALLLVGVGAVLGYGAYVTTSGRAEDLPPGDVKVASRGEAFAITDQLVPGKYTIFDFYADWCAPCRALDPELRRLASKRPDVAVRKVDIVDWESAVVRQYGVTALPHMKIYDPKGILLGEGDDAYRVLQEILKVDAL